MKNTACDPCAQIIEREITAANHFSDWLKQQVQLGVREDNAPAQGLLMHLQRDLAALQGGLILALPAAPKTDAAATARRQFRKVLEAQIDLARVAFERIQKQRELGIESTTDALLAELYFLDLQLEAAAFDAGLTFPARTRDLNLSIEMKASRTHPV